jgi:hypothetical protein
VCKLNHIWGQTLNFYNASLPVEPHSFGKVRDLLIVSPISLISRYNLLILFTTLQQAEFPFPLVNIGH